MKTYRSFRIWFLSHISEYLAVRQMKQIKKGIGADMSKEFTAFSKKVWRYFR